MRLIRLALLCVTLLCISQTTDAAYLYLDPADPVLYRGDTATVAVRIDTDEDECINVVDAVIEYPKALRAIAVSRGSSILNVWVEDPVIDLDLHQVRFAGGIPGGYCGRIPGDPRLTNIVAEIVFESPGTSISTGGTGIQDTSVDFLPETQVLLHDGLGTPAKLRYSGAIINLRDEVGQSINDEWIDRVNADTQAPADFNISLARDPNSFSGQYFITFNSNDKQSGVDHYEVMEEPFEDFYLFKWGRADAPWIEATSPYVLRDQGLNSTIRVKAIDKAGNSTIATLVPDTALRSLSTQRLVTSIVFGFVALVLIGGVILALLRRKRQLDSEYDKSSLENNDR